MEYTNIFLDEVFKIAFILVPVLVSVAFVVWLDRRIWGAVQKRRGPNVVGPFGLLQTLADALKYIFKEIIIPASSNKVIFILAPIITMTLALHVLRKYLSSFRHLVFEHHADDWTLTGVPVLLSLIFMVSSYLAIDSNTW